MIGSEPRYANGAMAFGLPFAPPEMVEVLLEQRETGVLQEPIIAPFAPTVEGREAMEEYQALPPPPEVPAPSDIVISPALLEFVAPGAPPEIHEAMAEEIIGYKEISPLAVFIEPESVGDMERQIEITEELEPYWGTSPGVLPPGVELPGFPDILGGLGTIGKYALMAGALIAGVMIVDRFTRKK